MICVVAGTSMKTPGDLTIPEPSLRRLPRYHRYLMDVRAQGRASVSCSLIGRDLKLCPVQVRKDLQFTGIVGRPKVGYPVPELLATLEKFLGWDSVSKAVLVGAGSLGTALLGYEQFSQHGLKIIAAFDKDSQKVGRLIHGKAILPLETLPLVAQRQGIHTGIITTPAGAAQQVADLMIQSGIEAIWNFAPVTLDVPNTIIVHNEDLYSSLAALTCKLATRLKASTHTGDSTHGFNTGPGNQRAEVREVMRDS
jgi:redox-sensing transcriptional repressor